MRAEIPSAPIASPAFATLRMRKRVRRQRALSTALCKQTAIRVHSDTTSVMKLAPMIALFPLSCAPHAFVNVPKHCDKGSAHQLVLLVELWIGYKNALAGRENAVLTCTVEIRVYDMVRTSEVTPQPQASALGCCALLIRCLVALLVINGVRPIGRVRSVSKDTVFLLSVKGKQARGQSKCSSLI